MPVPISDLALLGDRHSAALVDRAGRLVWWCPPRFDARAGFAALLDPEAGHFSVAPVAPARVERRYRPDSLVLETTFTTGDGAVRLTEALALGPGERGTDIGSHVPHALVRCVEGLAGAVELAVEHVPRPDFCLVIPELAAVDGGIRTRGGPDSFHLASDVPLTVVDHGRAEGHGVVRAGERLGFVLQHRPGYERSDFARLDPWAALEDTDAGWRSWVAGHAHYDGAYGAEVERSALVLQALTYAPTGAIVAAPTTSLPEVPGGPANWDYRFAWLRDASLTVRALDIAASPADAQRWLDFIARVGLESRADGLPQIVLGVAGERDLTEHELGHLEGWGGATPIRRGNAAWRQRQLDVPGEVLDAVWALRERLGELDPSRTRFVARLADAVVSCWREPDSGIWEGREGERRYTHSTAMCWVALDRAVRLAPLLGVDGARTARWAAERDVIRETVLREGWHEGVGAFTGALGSDHLDVAVLRLPITGLVDARDERMRRTVEVLLERLAPDGFLRRWTEGLDEAPFAIVQFWLAECLARAGEVARARDVFERTVACANDLGLLAEAIDPAGGLLGNFPQTFSHVGLVHAAWTITEAST